jgi:hypothetical protein
MPQIDALGGVELRLVFCENLATLGEPIVVHENVEIIPDRLGKFRLRIHQVHDSQIGLEPRGEALKTLLRNAATLRVGP